MASLVLNVLKNIIRGSTPIKKAGVEITSYCNLSCEHCYRHKRQYEDLTLEGWKEIFKNLKAENITAVAWVGGEPVYRTSIIKMGLKYFPLNIVITNGTLGIPKLDNVIYGVSVDGPKNIHDKIRGVGTYDLIEKNIKKAVDERVNVYVLMTITNINKGHIWGYAREWKEKGVKGIVFDFYTPQMGGDKLWVTFEERNIVLKEIELLHKEYGSFIPWNTPEMCKRMSYPNCVEHTKRCENLKKYMINSYGKQMVPCIMGGETLESSKVDCSRCGKIEAYPYDRKLIWNVLKGIYL